WRRRPASWWGGSPVYWQQSSERPDLKRRNRIHPADEPESAARNREGSAENLVGGGGWSLGRRRKPLSVVPSSCSETRSRTSAQKPDGWPEPGRADRVGVPPIVVVSGSAARGAALPLAPATPPDRDSPEFRAIGAAHRSGPAIPGSG